MNFRARWIVLRSVLFSIGFGMATLLTPAAVEQLHARQIDVCRCNAGCLGQSCSCAGVNCDCWCFLFIANCACDPIPE